jgi:DNA/RNA endonuclease YhcR with UshA esterase domain
VQRVASELAREQEATTAPRHPEPAAPKQVTREQIGAWVTAEGIVERPVAFSQGVRARLCQEGGTCVTIVLWKDTLAGGVQPFDAGSRLRVRGKVSEYNGALELTPKGAADVTQLRRVALAAWPQMGPAPRSATPERHAATPAVRERVGIGVLSAADEGRTVSVQGTLGTARRISKGTVYELSEGGSGIKLLLWEDVASALGATIAAGACVQVTGRVKVFQGALEIVPRDAGDVLSCTR